MKPRRFLISGVAVALLVGWLTFPQPAAAAGSHVVSVCGRPAPSHMACFADVVVPSSATSLRPNVITPFTGPCSLPCVHPADIQAAYHIPGGNAGAGVTVAIVDAYHNGNAAADLNAYRAQFGLPPCTTFNGCFHQLDQIGGTNYPAPDAGWSLESDLDIEAVSAACPKCSIELIEADDASSSSLYVAVDTATASGASAVSLSWGGAEYGGETSADSHFAVSGVAIVAASGDSGYGTSYPAASPDVISAGGTTLTHGAGWTQTAWSGTGSGCSPIEAKPSWQTDPDCGTRMLNDASADADPYTPLAVYSQLSWTSAGGTSLATPIIAADIAASGGQGIGIGASQVYSTWALNDVTSGNNGSCSPAYYCTAQSGYDGPTGLGSPWTASPSATQVDFGRYYAPGLGHWVTTGSVTSQFVTGGGHEEVAFGSLRSASAPGMVPLFDCVAGSIHFVSPAPSCEGQTRIGIDGWAANPSTGIYTVPLYRCSVPGSNDHFVAMGPACEGQTNEGLLGYAANDVALWRTWNPSIQDHTSVAGVDNPSASVDGTLGWLDVVGTVSPSNHPLFDCLWQGHHFTSPSGTCEGQTMVGLDGFAADVGGAGLAPLHRCTFSGTTSHFDTTSPTCEGGGTDEGIIGYLRTGP